MRLRTIWTLRAMSFPERLNRTREWGWRTVAHHLPRPLAYWSFIDSGVRYIRSDEVVPDVPFTDLLQRMGKEVAR